MKREATLAVAFEWKCFKNHCSESVSLDGLAPTGQYVGQTGQDPVVPMEIDTIQKLRGGQTEEKNVDIAKKQVTHQKLVGNSQAGVPPKPNKTKLSATGAGKLDIWNGNVEASPLGEFPTGSQHQHDEER